MRVCSDCGRCFDDRVGFCVEPGHLPLPEPLGGGVEMIEGYCLEQVFRSDRSGSVYYARHIDSGRHCIIRVVRTDAPGDERFISEANLAAGMFAPGMVDVYEAGQLDTGECFVVFEEGEGQTVRELLNAVGVPQLLTTIQIVRQAAEALHAIHLKGLIHGAVRPENILLSRDIEHRMFVRLQGLDLGGIEHRSIIGNKFLIDQSVGSIKYFSPEQCAGEAATTRSDVYGLGIVLYEMLAGAPPFEAATGTALIGMHKSRRPAEVTIDDFDLRMLLTHTLMESLTKHPEGRQTSANAFARQMRHIEQLATHVSTPPPVVSAPARPMVDVNISVKPFDEPPVPAKPIDTVSIAAAIPEPDYSPDMFQAGPVAEVYDRTTATSDSSVLPTIPLEWKAQDGPPPRSEQILDDTQTPESEGKIHPPEHHSRLRQRRRKLHSLITDLPAAAASAASEIVVPDDVEKEPLYPRSETAAEVVQPSVIESSVSLSPRVPARIEWDQPEDDIPSVSDVLDVLGRENISEAPDALIEQPPAAPRPVTEAAPRARQRPAVPPAPKAAAAGNAVTGVATRPTPAAKATPGVKGRRQPPRRTAGFYPTLLGTLDNDKTASHRASGPIFAGYDSGATSGLHVPFRPIAIGAGVLAIISLFLFGNGPIERYFQTGSRGDAVSARSETAALPAAPQAESKTEPLPAAPYTEFKTEPAIDKNNERTARPPDLDKKERKKELRLAATENTPPVREKKEAPPERKPRPAQPVAPIDTAPRVIIVGAKPKVYSVKADNEKRSRGAENKKSGTTRPRIVKEANQ